MQITELIETFLKELNLIYRYDQEVDMYNITLKSDEGNSIDVYIWKIDGINAIQMYVPNIRVFSKDLLDKVALLLIFEDVLYGKFGLYLMKDNPSYHLSYGTGINIERGNAVLTIEEFQDYLHHTSYATTKIIGKIDSLLDSYA